MNAEILAILSIIAVALILFATEIIKAEVTSLLVMVLLMVFGFVTPSEGISGFSNPATITILALLLLSEGIRQTGVVGIITEKLYSLVGNSKTKLILSIIIVPAILSAFINNTAIVAIFIPVVIQLSKKVNISPSQLLIPLSFASMAGGSATLIGSSTNLIVHDIAISNGLEGIQMFDLSPYGVFLILIVVLFIFFFGQHIIPNRKNNEIDLTSEFDTDQLITEVVIQKGSSIIDCSIENSPFRSSEHIETICIIRDNGKRWLPDEVERIREGDVFVVKCEREKLLDLLKGYNTQIGDSDTLNDEKLVDHDGTLVELLISPTSNFVGSALSDMEFKSKFGVVILAIRKRKKLYVNNIQNKRLEIGDVLLVESKASDIERFRNSHDVVLLNVLSDSHKAKKEVANYKSFLSVAIVAGVVVLAALNIWSIVTAAWAGCVIMFVTGCLDPAKGTKNIQWSVIFLLAGLIPLGVAMKNTGTTEWISNLLIYQMDGWNLPTTVAVIYLFTVFITSIMSNNATAILLAPIAIEMAYSLGFPPEALLITVIIGANSSFLTPIGYQTNTMIYKAGNYKFLDFTKVGGMLTLLFLIVITILITYMYA